MPKTPTFPMIIDLPKGERIQEAVSGKDWGGSRDKYRKYLENKPKEFSAAFAHRSALLVHPFIQRAAKFLKEKNITT